MRGPRASSLRGNKPRQEPVQQPSEARTIPAPVGGWNARDPIAQMNPLDAIVMDNWYPTTGTVELRSGKSVWSTGLNTAGQSLLTYNGPSAQKMFAVTATNFYEVTSIGAVGAAATTCTNGRWEFLNFTTSGGAFMIAVNGVDKPKSYDGTNWVNIDAASTPAITGVTTTTLTNIHMFKRRIWFVAANSMTAWYLPVDSVGGAVTAFPMGPIFKRGGHLIAQASWTLDGGTGADDLLVTVTSEGELAVYQGTDPASASTFALIGVYYVGKPLGKKCFVKYGGDLLFLSRQGIFLLSKLLLSITNKEATTAVSYKIDGAMQAVIPGNADKLGWQAVIYPKKNALILNVPITQDSISYQYVMNDITKAWCRFTNWSAAALAMFQESLYAVVGTEVHLLWTGLSDAGTAITGRVQQAYTNFKTVQEKQVSLVRPNVAVSGNMTVSLSFDTDFAYDGDDSQVSYSIATGSPVWDVGLWDTAVWSAGSNGAGFQASWLTVANNPSFFHSFRLQLTTSSATVLWAGTDYVLQKGGIL